MKFVSPIPHQLDNGAVRVNFKGKDNRFSAFPHWQNGFTFLMFDGLRVPMGWIKLLVSPRIFDIL
jgi:hypothetical protein